MRSVFALAVLCTLLCPSSAIATEAPAVGAPAETSLALDAWLVAGPINLALPAFAGERAGENAAPPMKGDALLDLALIDTRDLAPRESDALPAPAEPVPSWTAASASDGVVLLDRGPGEALRAAWLAAYVTTDRFVAGTLEIKSEHPVRVHLGTTMLGGAKKHDIALPRGTHLVLIEAVADPADDAAWTIAATLHTDAPPATVSVGRSPARLLQLEDILDATSLAGLALSADGRYVAVERATPAAPSDDREQWIEIRDLRDGRVLRRSDGAWSGFVWSHAGDAFAYVTRHDKKATVWLSSVDGPAKPVLRDIEDLGEIRFSPDDRALFYVVSDEAETPERVKKTGLVRVPSLAWRNPENRQRGHLHEVRLADGARRRLTAGAFTATLADVSPDGTKLLVLRERPDVMESPFSTTEIWEIDRASLATRLIANPRWNAQARYAGDAKQLVVVAGPMAWGEIGALASVERPNEYEGEIYLVDAATGAATSLSRDFSPSVKEARVSAVDGSITIRAEDGEFERLYRLDATTGTFRALPSEVDVIAAFDIARRAPAIVYRGTSAADPGGLFALESADAPASRLLADAASPHFRRDITPGDVQDFDFSTPDGTIIRGHIHFPPGFDASRRYPALVYYYGGTSPVSRTFGGRYPFALWAAHGYVVYVLQPSGATGFGPEFAARHVNDWGRTTVGEIILGTQRFVEAHPFVDPARVGCLGASYGGFMTQLLVTHTDMFRAAISHAGISAIPSYWGEGLWGYLYSAQAAADSYPWNATDFYVGQSPLFRADRIKTPLLLLHGSADTNVPPGESEQMFTALKILGREVEYVRVQGEDHWIVPYDKRKAWSETILAWFDRHLKDEPEWWNHIFAIEPAEAARDAN